MTWIDVDEQLTGPAGTAQGGIAAGLLAAHLDGPVEVRLQAPPPLATRMQVERHEDGLRAVRDGTTVMTARAVPAVDVELPDVDLELARDASDPPDEHRAPVCFVCGDQHPRGLHLHPGQVDDSEAVACRWEPPDHVADGKGNVRPEIVWGVLDCPGGWAMTELGDLPDDAFPALGTITADLRAPIPAGTPTLVFGWSLGSQGRRHLAASAITDLDGEVHAVARQICIAMPLDWAG